MNAEIEDFQKKISNNELKRLVGIEGRFAFIQNELTAVKRLQIEQKDCADVNSNLFFFVFKLTISFSIYSLNNKNLVPMLEINEIACY